MKPTEPEKIVIVEDETDIREVIQHNLEREGYEVYASPDGEAGLALIRETHPNLVLLDLMLPGLDGIEVCKALKADSAAKEIPIIMVTAKGEESDIVLGLNLGADDYVAKPFSPKELIARVKAVLRRRPLKEEDANPDRIVRGEIAIDIGRHEVQIKGVAVAFTATELRLLHFLASHPGRVFTRESILNQVMGLDAFLVDRNIDVHIRSVRKKLGEHRNWIETLRGVGYRFLDEENSPCS